MSKYVPYHAESRRTAMQLCANIRGNPLQKYNVVTGYVAQHFRYDFVRAAQIAKLRGQYPDIERTWKTHMGVCMDIAAMTTGMLRAVGVNAHMCVGHADRNYHAWVQAEIGGQTYRFDHSGKAKKYVTERKY